MRGKIQMVFQDPYASLNPCLTVRQTLREALLPHLRRKYGVRKRIEEKIELKIREMLELTGLKRRGSGPVSGCFLRRTAPEDRDRQSTDRGAGASDL